MFRLRLCVGPVLMCVVDATVTLVCQPAEYWAGEYAMAKEANPLALWLMCWHPLAFACGVVVMLAVYVLLVVRLSPSLARVLAFVIVLLHALGAASWVIGRGIMGFALGVAWVVFGSWLLGWSWGDHKDQ